MWAKIWIKRGGKANWLAQKETPDRLVLRLGSPKGVAGGGLVYLPICEPALKYNPGRIQPLQITTQNTRPLVGRVLWFFSLLQLVGGISEVSRNSIWITWERQRRNRSASQALGAELYELTYEGGRLSRYLHLIKRTYKVIKDTRPDVVFGQNPSLILALFLVCYRLVGFRYTLVLDYHNAAFDPPVFAGKHLAKWITRRADFILVTNQKLVGQVAAWGGAALVLPDPLPEFHPVEPIALKSPSVLFVCSWADDEPISDVIAAASKIEPLGGQIYITGKVKGTAGEMSLPSNIHLTGFLPDKMFESYMSSVDVVMDLTTREDCMVCGAYEALAMKKPLILSSNEPTCAYFGSSAEYTDNTADSIAGAMVRVFENLKEKNALAAAWKEKVEREFPLLVADVKNEIGMSVAARLGNACQ